MREISKLRLPKDYFRYLNPILQKDFKLSFSTLSQNEGFPVKTFDDLRRYVAELAILYPSNLLFFRGQNFDFKNDKDKKSTFLPSIYRKKSQLNDKFKFLSKQEDRWRYLDLSSNILCDLVNDCKIEGINQLKKRRLIQWSILQHYEIALTPLIDVTQSLRVACSFASLDNMSNQAYLYVFALPYYHNRISRDSEEELTNIRLISICPPSAKRPYYQEAFLIGEEDIELGNKRSDYFDLRRRLIAKFFIQNLSDFWKFESKMDRTLLYPPNDEMEDICKKVEEKSRKNF